jgi:hypothetical protein
MAAPGVVLKRPVGSSGSFKEDAELPTDLAGDGKPSKTARKSTGRKPKKPHVGPADKAAERKAALAYEREERRRARERAKEEAARRRSVSASSRPSTGRRRLWTRPSANTRRRQRPSKPKCSVSRKNRKPKMPGGIRKGGGWKPRCGAREAPTRVLARKKFADPLKLFPAFQIFLASPPRRSGCPRGPAIETGAGRCPEPARTHLAPRRIWI